MSNEKLNSDNENEMITLTFEDGTEAVCYIIAVFNVDGKDYAALMPEEPLEGYEPDDLLLYRYQETSDDEVILNTIEDDDEFEKAADAFDELLDEEAFNNMPD